MNRSRRRRCLECTTVSECTTVAGICLGAVGRVGRGASGGQVQDHDHAALFVQPVCGQHAVGIYLSCDQWGGRCWEYTSRVTNGVAGAGNIPHV
jgi:hypothetical protein